MRDELVEIDATALRFDADESQNFLVDLGGLDLDRTEVDDLTESTDGWVAALQLASLSLRGADDPARLIDNAQRAAPCDQRVSRRERPRHAGAGRCWSSCSPPRSPNGSAAGWPPRSPACPTGRRCSSRSRSRTCSCAGWTTSGSAITTCSPSSCASDSNATTPTGSRELHRTASRWFAEHRYGQRRRGPGARRRRRGARGRDRREGRQFAARPRADGDAARAGRQASALHGRDAPAAATRVGVGEHHAAPVPGAERRWRWSTRRWSGPLDDGDRRSAGRRPTWCGACVALRADRIGASTG